ncbi:hypothetical protein OIY81_775 [Cryptosporidium canis]|uniref:Uncharacterized protein n=1 Tax=Cryptosporidium canis TaxID=195482 RepID=A0ABQ8P9Z3_9CRYT|nr:hypothetical protein OJ252_1587 [Cryptosporidium canis]KAJ1613903.1 hypothetical protein OIY81_775 [Cryptosporidium canis]
MDVNILKTLDVDELIIIESRLKSSIANLNQLLSELYNENCRISISNLELKELRNRSPSAAERIGNIVKHAVFSQLKCQGRDSPIEFHDCYKSSDRKLNCGVGNLGRDSKIKIEEASCSQIDSNVDTNEHSVLLNLNDSRPISIDEQILCSNNCGSHNQNTSCVLVSRNFLADDIKANDESADLHMVDILLDENSYAKIKFSRFDDDQSREGFVKDIIENIGLKPIYFDCIKNILKDIEDGRKCIDNVIDIADLDPWENNHDGIFLRQSEV